MNYLFLDIDGVVNSHEFFFGPSACGTLERDGQPLSAQIDPRAIAHLNAIINATQAEVVISSSWRQVHSVGTIARALRDKGFTGKVIGKTGYRADGDSSDRRGLEILDWLKAQQVMSKRWVILDDSADMGVLLPCLVRTTWNDGLLAEHVAPAIKILLEGP